MHYFNPDHKHHVDQEAADEDGDYNYLTVAFLSLILGLGTCFLALVLRCIKHSPFCCNDQIRSTATDFAITISVALFTLIKELLFPGVHTEELNVPNSFAPTFNCCDESCRTYFPDDCPEQEHAYGRRSWFVDLFDLNGKSWIVFVAAGPAALAFILAFLDNGITWHIINHPSNKLSHGEAYNYDTCVSAIMVAANSMIGLPWLVASTVPCMMHGEYCVFGIWGGTCTDGCNSKNLYRLTQWRSLPILYSVGHDGKDEGRRRSFGTGKSVDWILYPRVGLGLAHGTQYHQIDSLARALRCLFIHGVGSAAGAAILATVPPLFHAGTCQNNTVLLVYL